MSLRVVGVTVFFLLLLQAVTQLLTWYRSPISWLPAILAALFLASSYGILRLWSWARWVAVVSLWLLILVLVVGIINPYTAMEMMHAGKSPPSVISLLAFIVPAVSAILWILHILGKYKTKFR